MFSSKHDIIPLCLMQDDFGSIGEGGTIKFRQGPKGQSISAMLGAYAYNEFPLMVDLTDGVVHHLLQMRGSDLFVWSDLSPTQAYWKQAQMLLSCAELLSDRKLRMAAIPEEMQAPLKRMRSSLRGTSGLRDQLDAVVSHLYSPTSKIQAAYEIIEAWEQAQGLEMQGFNSMYV